jgi:hypothetical protein
MRAPIVCARITWSPKPTMAGRVHVGDDHTA